MARQTSDKHSLRSDAQKRAAARHDAGPMPATQPVPGALGRPQQRATPRRAGAAGSGEPPSNARARAAPISGLREKRSAGRRAAGSTGGK
jgi:hypothetical protein